MKHVHIIKFADCPNDILVFSSRRKAEKLLSDQYQTGEHYGKVVSTHHIDITNTEEIGNEHGLLATLKTFKVA